MPVRKKRGNMEDDIDQEFIIEANELIEQAEEALIELEKNNNFEENYKVSMRCLHTLKGAFGMFGMVHIESATHHFEDLLTSIKETKSISRELVDYLLNGLDQVKISLNSNALNEIPLLSLNEILKDLPQKREINHAPKDMSLQSSLEKIDRHRTYVTNASPKKKDYIGTAFIIEDEQEIRRHIVKKLTKEKIQCFDFDDAHLALKEIKNHKPDVIITDLRMPKMNGMDFITELRKEFVQLPVIIVSAYLTKEACIQALSQGAAGVIEKPFDAQDLINMTKINIIKHRSYKLLNQSLRYMQFQFSDLEQYLTRQGEVERRDAIKYEIQTIMVEKRKLDKFKI